MKKMLWRDYENGKDKIREKLLFGLFWLKQFWKKSSTFVALKLLKSCSLAALKLLKIAANCI